METKKAFVLSGGSIKGTFQAGAIKAFLENGFKPEMIYGISVGSLNTTFLSHDAGKQNKPKEEIDWQLIGENLKKFWFENIQKPEDVAIKRGAVEIGWDALTKTFNGLLDTTPIQELVKKTIKMENLYNSPVSIKVGAVNIADGKIVYADPSFPNFLDYVLASTAIPIMMPGIKIGGNKNQLYMDGGIKDVAPLKQAIDSGATEIVVICCQSKDVGAEVFDSGNLLKLSERLMDIIVNEIVNNDIEWAEYFNKFLPEDGSVETNGPFAGYRKIKITVVRPAVPINLDLENFNSEDIQAIFESGYRTALEEIKK
ncbi:MAG: patatin-like phospholipase family protein [Bacteroidetes bacterium]|nr:patatin-like phospholipase family protein [Bacteroidota bacterium]